MISVHSSGSRCSAAAVDPVTSQNSIVTTRLSPTISPLLRAASSLLSSSLGIYCCSWLPGAEEGLLSSCSSLDRFSSCNPRGLAAISISPGPFPCPHSWQGRAFVCIEKLPVCVLGLPPAVAGRLDQHQSAVIAKIHLLVHSEFTAWAVFF